MSKRKKRKYGISRRINGALWGNIKDPYHKRNYPPGMHGMKGYKKSTEFGNQLIEKQKLKKYYGDIKEKQFKKIYEKALSFKGNTGDNLVGLLESRLDVIVYRSKFATSIFEARQIVNHKHIKINGFANNIPSYNLKPGDIISINEKYNIKLKNINFEDTPKHLETHHKTLTSIYLRIPKFIDINYPIDIDLGLIIEFYSK